MSISAIHGNKKWELYIEEFWDCQIGSAVFSLWMNEHVMTTAISLQGTWSMGAMNLIQSWKLDFYMFKVYDKDK